MTDIPNTQPDSRETTILDAPEMARIVRRMAGEIAEVGCHCSPFRTTCSDYSGIIAQRHPLHIRAVLRHGDPS